MDSYICLNTSDGVVVLRISPLHQFLFYFVQGQFFKSRVRFSVSFRFVLVGNNTDSVLRRFRSWTSGSLSPSVFFCDYQGLTLLCAYFKFYQFFSSVNYISILVYRRTRPEWLWLLRLRLRLGGRRVYTAVYGVEVAAGWAGMIVPRGYRRFGDGWVRFNRISNILPIRRLHPARTFFQTTIRRIFYAIGWVCDSGFSSGSRSI
jgi:hypothetical protein